MAGVVDLLVFGQADGGAGGWITSFLPMILVMMVAYIFLIQRPQRREQATRDTMLKNLKKNDRVVTTSGIYGVVTNVQLDANEVTIRVDEANNTRLKMTLAAVSRVVGSDAAAEAPAK